MTAPSLTNFANGVGSVNADELNTFQRTANTYSDLRGYTGTEGVQVFVRGGSAVADGDQGVFYWSAASTAADNGSTVIAPSGATTGRWLRLTIGAAAVISATATGTNAITLTPIASSPTVAAYFNHLMYVFVAPATSTGAVTVGTSLGLLKLYTAGQTSTQATTGDILINVLYLIAYNSALDSGAGGFVIVSAIAGAGAATGTAAPLNMVIGGDFSTNPWQRGTSFSSIANTYSADNWLYSSAGTGVVDITKSADAPTTVQAEYNSDHCLMIDCTTADAAIAAGDLYSVETMIEGYNAAPCFGRAVTLTFWHKHTKTGTYCVAFRSGAADASYVAEYTQAVTDTWELATVTLTITTSVGTWNSTNGTGLGIFFTVASGSTYQTSANTWAAGNFLATANQVNGLDSTSNNFRIALVQLVAGGDALAFQQRTAGQELALCRRYLPAFVGVAGPIGTGWNDSTTIARQNLHFDVPARTAPTGITVSNGAHFTVAETAGAIATTAVAFSAANIYGLSVDATVAAGLTDGRGSSLQLANASAALYCTGAEMS